MLSNTMDLCQLLSARTLSPLLFCICVKYVLCFICVHFVFLTKISICLGEWGVWKCTKCTEGTAKKKCINHFHRNQNTH